jgi:hypothetical protein
LYVDSTGEAPAYDSTRNHRIGTRHVVERMSSESASSPSDTEENNPAVKQTNPVLHDYSNSNVKNVQRIEYVKSKPSNSIRNSRIYEDTGGRGLSERTVKVYEYIYALSMCFACNRRFLLFTYI